MKTIVVIDRDALARALLAECLSGQDWTVLEAEDGQAGVDLVLKNRPAAVLCEIRAAKRNGFQVCRLIREHATLSSTKIILISVSNFASDRETALAAGANNYLVKPIVPTELLEILGGAEEAAVTPAATAPEIAASGPTLFRFWGVRGSIPSPGRDTATYGGNTSCIEVRCGHQVIILDAGSGLRRLGQNLMGEVGPNGLNLTFLITQTHWDHIQGFPFFMPAYHPRVKIRIFGHKDAVHGLRGALFEQMQSAFFPVGLKQIAAHVTFDELESGEFNLGAVKIRPMLANHPGTCLGYRLSTPGGEIVYLPDHEVYERSEMERQKFAGTISKLDLEQARAQDAQVIEFLRGADVIIADAQYDAIEYPPRRGWGHACVDDTVQLAMRAGAKQLFLFHHDPDHNDEKIASMARAGQKEATKSGSNLRVAAACEGETVTLKG